MVFADTEGWTSTTEGDEEATPIGAKLLIGSYCTFLDIVGAIAMSFVTHMSVRPSAGAAAASVAPRAPLAPLTFSTKNCWPSASDNFCAERRAIRSVGPPGG